MHLGFYTKKLFYLVSEEIKSACYHTSIPDMWKDQHSRYFKVEDELMGGKIFEVSVSLSDHNVTCSCNFYFQRGYLCRHEFAALHQCGVKEIPRQYVKTRWSKHALKRNSVVGSQQIYDQCAKLDRMKMKRTNSWFYFQKSIDYAGEDEEKLDTVVSDLEGISSKLEAQKTNGSVQGSNHRSDKYVGPQRNGEINVHNPNISRNKGCGSRIKSSREISIEEGRDKRRKCSKCDMVAGHNARSCPLNKQ